MFHDLDEDIANFITTWQSQKKPTIKLKNNPKINYALPIMEGSAEAPIRHYNSTAVELTFHSKGMLDDVKNLTESIKNGNSSEREEVLNVLQKYISKNTRITIHNGIDRELANILNDVTRQALEEIIHREWLLNNKLQYTKSSSDQEKEQEVEGLLNVIPDLEKSGLIKTVERRVQTWYNIIINKKKVNLKNYFKCIRYILYERVLSRTLMSKGLLNGLKEFSENIRKLGPACPNVDLFHRKKDNTYNLDHAVGLILRNYDELSNYSTDKHSQIVQSLSPKDISLICEVYNKKGNVFSIINTLQYIHDNDMHINNYLYSENTEETDQTIYTETISNVEKEDINDELESFLSEDSFNSKEKVYIKERISFFREKLTSNENGLENIQLQEKKISRKGLVLAGFFTAFTTYLIYRTAGNNVQQ
ncbi:hypothetical protein NEPAR04_0396 [Nematocida parisii]|nr:hypothetical protein NEPAR03_0014 [Nematocida parisii]KAI5125463.1 hypothetical protein NEPAR08_0014 [Nematocida parisii]KAI5140655.1 hypothetical protein NEPAR04_0396 [Nematocida parisii]